MHKALAYLKKYLLSGTFAAAILAVGAKSWIEAVVFAFVFLVLTYLGVRVFWRSRQKLEDRARTPRRFSWRIEAAGVVVGSIDDAELARIDQRLNRDATLWVMVIVDKIRVVTRLLAQALIASTAAVFAVLVILFAGHAEAVSQVLAEIAAGGEKARAGIQALGQIAAMLVLLTVVLSTFLSGNVTGRHDRWQARRLRAIGERIGYPLTSSDDVDLLDGRISQNIASISGQKPVSNDGS